MTFLETEWITRNQRATVWLGTDIGGLGFGGIKSNLLPKHTDKPTIGSTQMAVETLASICCSDKCVQSSLMLCYEHMLTNTRCNSSHDEPLSQFTHLCCACISVYGKHTPAFVSGVCSEPTVATVTMTWLSWTVAPCRMTHETDTQQPFMHSEHDILLLANTNQQLCTVIINKEAFTWNVNLYSGF